MKILKPAADINFDHFGFFLTSLIISTKIQILYTEWFVGHILRQIVHKFLPGASDFATIAKE